MRTIGGLIILVAVVGLSGCRSSGSNAPKPDAPAAPSKTAPEPTLPADLGGVIYGRVKDNFNLPVSKAFIEVVDLQDSQPAGTRFEVSTSAEGLFDINSLKPGHRYRLIARVDGSTLYGIAEVTTPSTNVLIRLVDDPDAKVPAKAAAPDLLPEKPKPQTSPKGQVPLGPPSTEPDAKASPEAKPAPAARPGSADTYDPSRVVDGSKGFGYTSPRQNPPPVSIQVAPPPPPPMAPAQDPVREQMQRVPTPVLPPADPNSVPSCSLSGDRLADFALFDLDGQPYRYRANSNGRVVLLLFWSSTEGASLEYLNVMSELYRVYSPYKLDVIGIAYEQGDLARQTQGVRSAKGRYGLRYTQLLGGEGHGACPVRSAFGVVEFPTVVLLDREGVIVYRTGRLPVGDSEQSKSEKLQKLHELEQKVRAALRVTDP